jgi:hypothetical protein
MSAVSVSVIVAYNLIMVRTFRIRMLMHSGKVRKVRYKEEIIEELDRACLRVLLVDDDVPTARAAVPSKRGCVI